MVKNKISLIAILIVLVLSSFVSAVNEDFQVTGTKEISVYECVVNQDGMIHVANTGDVPSGYTISVGGDAAKFVSLGPINFVLDPGQSQDILTFFTVPCNSKGQYDLDIYINTVLDTKKVLNQKIIVEKPKNIQITPIIYSQKIKPCATASYQFNINNSGSFDETYSIIFEKPFGDYVSVNFNQITLPPNQEAPLTISIKPSCELYGNFTIPFAVKTANTKITAKTSAYLIIDKAYDYSLKLGDIYSNSATSNNATNNTSIFSDHNIGEIYLLCANSKEKIPVQIKNNADLANTFYLKLDELSPKWISLSADSIELNKSQEKIVELNIDTNNIEGDYNFIFGALSEYGQIQKIENITLSIENCYKPQISTLEGKKSFVLDYNSVKVPISVSNTGSKTANYIFSLSKTLNWLSIEPSTLTIEPGKTDTTYIVSTPNELTKRGSYKTSIQMSVDKTNVVYSDSFTISLATMNAFDRFYYNIFIPYIWYFILGLLVLIILLILLIILFKKLKNKIKKIKERKAIIKKRTEKQVKPRSRLKLILLILLFLILMLFAFYMLFKEKITSNTAYQTTTSKIQDIWNTVYSKTSSLMTTKIIPAIKSFFIDYWLYVVIGFAALIILIILLLVIPKIIRKIALRKRFKKQKIIRVEKKAEKAKPKKRIKIKINKKLLFIILGVIILAGIGYLVYYFSAWNYVANLFARNESISAENITEQAAEQTGPSFFSVVSDKITSLFSKTYAFIYNYMFYILIGIAVLVLLSLLLLLIRHIIKSKIAHVDIESASGEIVLRNNKISCGEIIIKLKREVNHVSLLLKKIRKPTFIGASGLVYEYFEFDKSNLDNSDIGQAIVRFRVKKSWLKRNNVRRSDISLKKYHNQWNGVNTKIVAEDNKYVYYESVLDHLSYFAIVGKPTEIKPKTIVREHKPEKKIKIDKNKLKKLFWFIIFLLILASLIFLGYHFWDKILSFLKTYLWYIIGAILVIVIIAIIPWIIKLIKWFNKKISKKLKKILLVILLALIILSLLVWGFACIIPKMSINLTDVLTIEYNAQNETNIAAENTTIQDNQTAAENEGIPDQKWGINTNLTIDLSKYFLDPDMDNLSYSNAQLEYIQIFYDDNKAILVPEKDWTGSEFVIFAADDMKGGKAESNIIKLTVD